MRWWGWGEDEGAVALPATALEQLLSELGMNGSERGQRVELEDVSLRKPALTSAAGRALEQAVGAEHVVDDRAARVTHALGKSLADLLRIRSGDGSGAPDAVVRPGSAEEVAASLAACAEAGVAVIPFGGGTSVVGGVEALPGEHAAAISMDLGRMDSVLEIDPRSRIGRFEPGLMGPELERRLARAGLTLGHFPQSFEFSTVGGWVATRSAGQASTGYGRIDELVESVVCACPAGVLATRAVPASAAGPSLRELLVGSEGTLGVITEATLRLRPLPETRHYEAWSFRSFEEGVEAFRHMEQAEASPDVARLSDEHETRLSTALAADGGGGGRIGTAYLRLRGHQRGCIAVAGFEGSAQEVARRRGRTAELLRAAGGLPLGQRPARSWHQGRFTAPYLRDELLDRGVMAETLETATTWSDLQAMYQAVGDSLREALAARGTPPLVMCHVSHLYTTGASLYFTFMARQEEGAGLDQWWAAKAAAVDAIVANDGTITHHHGVGRDHTPWMSDEVGEPGLDLLRAAKERLDPTGIMNPGKLLPDR
ncbi:MAG: FAD-binding oxidoreductase [Actinomycetota bacterium]|nr:FAD-binding oxidoreductase [Actinomycetota bacterium]